MRFVIPSISTGPPGRRGAGCPQRNSAVMAGHAFIQNVRRGHDELGVEADPQLWVAAAFDELSHTI